MSVDYRDMGYRIRTVRHRQKLTLAEVAEKAGITASYLGHVERGSRVASLETLVSLCNSLQVSPTYLLGASLKLSETETPTDVTGENRQRLNEFLRMAEDAINNWNE